MSCQWIGKSRCWSYVVQTNQTMSSFSSYARLPLSAVWLPTFIIKPSVLSCVSWVPYTPSLELCSLWQKYLSSETYTLQNNKCIICKEYLGNCVFHVRRSHCFFCSPHAYDIDFSHRYMLPIHEGMSMSSLQSYNNVFKDIHAMIFLFNYFLMRYVVQNHAVIVCT